MTVYIVVTFGETVIKLPVRLPGCQVYVKAPEAVRLDELGKQSSVWEEMLVSVGLGLTNSEVVMEDKQPSEVVALIVKLKGVAVSTV